MDRGGVYIDDAGNPGAESGSDFLSSSRKSWTAVIVPSSIASKVATAMEMFLTGVRSDFGASELHFTDIYSGRGAWKNVAVDERIKIFDLMKVILTSFALPIVHQTASEETLLEVQDPLSQFVRTPGTFWDIENVSHFGFLLLCFKVSRHLLELHENGPDDFVLPMPLFVDEGLAKEGTSIDLPNWGEVIEGPRAQFCGSENTTGIQIADFAAFAITRTQWIMAQQETDAPTKRGDLDFLKSTSEFNVLNLPVAVIPPESLSRESYEHILAGDRRMKGLSSKPIASKRKR